MLVNNQIVYSPTENHLAVIYSDRHGLKRFNRFVTEKEHLVFFPRPLTRLFVLKEINLGPRTAHLFFSNVFTADRVPLELELKVFFRFDPRNAVEDNFIQVINLQNQAFEGIINTNIEKIIRNDVFVQKNAEDILFSRVGKRDVQKVLSARIAERAKNFGITINPSFGASIINMQPDKVYKRALSDEAAAEAQSRAAAKRLVESLKNTKGLTQEETMQMLLMEITSAIVKTGKIPEHLINNRYVDEQVSGNGFYRKTPAKKPSPKMSSPERELPFAE